MFNPAIDPDTPSPARPGLTLTPTALRTQAACLRFTTVLLCVCLFLQRLGVPASFLLFPSTGSYRRFPPVLFPVLQPLTLARLRPTVLAAPVR